MAPRGGPGGRNQGPPPPRQPKDKAAEKPAPRKTVKDVPTGLKGKKSAGPSLAKVREQAEKRKKQLEEQERLKEEQRAREEEQRRIREEEERQRQEEERIQRELEAKQREIDEEKHAEQLQMQKRLIANLRYLGFTNLPASCGDTGLDEETLNKLLSYTRGIGDVANMTREELRHIKEEKAREQDRLEYEREQKKREARRQAAERAEAKIKQQEEKRLEEAQKKAVYGTVNWDDSSDDDDDDDNDHDAQNKGTKSDQESDGGFEFSVDSDGDEEENEDDETDKPKPEKSSRPKKTTSDESDDSDNEDSEESSFQPSWSESDEKPNEAEELAKAEAAKRGPVLRAPIATILGHVDTGKTSILDNIRSSHVQAKEAGGITQQIGATFFPVDFIREKIQDLTLDMEINVPGLLIIDTPGHASFANLRSRGSGICDIAILVVDIMHGLEPQTLESISLLKASKTPFIIALNKIDRLNGWKPVPNASSRERVTSLTGNPKRHFDERWMSCQRQLGEQGFSSELYWKNKQIGSCLSVVPTSARTGEGMSDLLAVFLSMAQRGMVRRLATEDKQFKSIVLEVGTLEGVGTTCDIILVNGKLKRGDTIGLCGLDGMIKTQIKQLLTPKAASEIRVKGEMNENDEVEAVQGLKLVAPHLENVVAGSSLVLIGPDDDEEAIEKEIMEDVEFIRRRFRFESDGILAQASTLGSLEALLDFLQEKRIPVSAVALGTIYKSSVLKASLQREKGNGKYAIILGFDVKADQDALKEAKKLGVEIITADIMYHLQEHFEKYRADQEEKERQAHRHLVVYPCRCTFLEGHTIRSNDPIIIGLRVDDGILVPGTPIVDVNKDNLFIGVVETLQKNKTTVARAEKGDEVAVRISPAQPNFTAGRHFMEKDVFISKISRESLEVMKKYFRDELTKALWKLVKDICIQLHV